MTDEQHLKDFERGLNDSWLRNDRDLNASGFYQQGWMTWYHALSKIEDTLASKVVAAENDLKGVTAERDGLGSKILDVQQESIWLRKALIVTYGEQQSTDVPFCGFGCGMNYGHREDCEWLAYLGGAKPWEDA